MQPDFFDNRARIVKDDLVANIAAGDRVAIAASVFSMYAYQELAEQLEGIDELRFVFTSQAFTKQRPAREKREFYIPRLSREQGLCGTDFEIRLRNELTQKAVATECADWIRRKARFRSFEGEGRMSGFLDVEKAEDNVAYMPFDGFTTRKLGCDSPAEAPDVTMRLDASQSRALLKQFDDAWDSGELHDVTDAVIDGITAMYQENAPELIYCMALYRIFSEFLDDVSEDVLPNEGLGFRESLIWNKLYDFQKDAALAIINKLETYNGCILADSVGLGKTFTALAVIKYYESRNKDVLVLCPKKLRDNWITYNSNVVNNPIAGDRLQYDVLYHTDLSRTRGTSETGLPLDRLNWGAYGLVVIDESHNFRNGGDSASEDRMNRYQLLMEKVIKQGVKTKVLMLSATPVNNRFRDLRNQLALAYWGDPTGWSEKLRLENDIETVFRNAQTVYARWSKLPAGQRTTHALTDMLDYDFFEVLDQVTVARSRKHIQRYYDMSAIGPFPKRLPPISKRPKLIELCEQIREKSQGPINPGNRKVLVFTAFSDTADYLYENVSAFAKRELGLECAKVTGDGCACTIKAVPPHMQEVLACFSPASKERDVVAPQLSGCDVDIVIATDCISEGQNLQDCDYLVNYDIHWNPVRIVQRFGRVDRIGSKNARIQLVNYWPDVELDEYIKLKARVEERMRITVMTSTGDDDYINADETGDLEYRRQQLEQMRDEVVDLEDVSGGVSITDLGLNEFRMDLVGYYRGNPDIDRLPSGINAVVEGDEPGVVFVLRNVNSRIDRDGANHLHPFYVVRMRSDGSVAHGHLEPKAVLDDMRLLCRGKSEPDMDLCRAYNRETKNGRDMRREAGLLCDAVASIVDSEEKSDVDSFFAGGTTGFLENDIEGLDNFELVCFLVVRPRC